MADPRPEPPRLNVLEVDASIAEAVTRPAGSWVTVGGIVGSTTTVSSPQGARMSVITVTDFCGTIEVLLHEPALAQFDPGVDDVVLAGGRLTRRGQRTVLTAQVVERYEFPIPR